MSRLGKGFPTGAAARTSLPVFICSSRIVVVRMFKSWHPFFVAGKLAAQVMHRSYSVSQFSCHAEHCPALHWSTSHTVILIPQSREKNLRSILASILLTEIRPEMFRFAQHDSSGICKRSSKPVALTRRCLGTSP